MAIAMYAQLPAEVKVCAMVSVAANTAVWLKDGVPGQASYQDMGSHIEYSNHVPHLVERLVENKTGRRIRFGCNIHRPDAAQ